MAVEENQPRRRTSTSVSPANSSLDLPYERDISDFHHNILEPVKTSSSPTQQRLSVFSTLLLLVSLILFALNVSAGRWKGARSHIGDFLAGGNDQPQAIPSLAIVLHPENHRSRNASIITLHWTITSDFRAPDGVKKKVYLINGEFPGPTIEARSGDTLVVHVENALESVDDGVSLHWHGLYMKEYNNMDGAVGLTQCPVSSGRNFTYEFSISDEQHGTFWYHAHSQVQRGDGLYGGLIVHQPNDTVSKELEQYGHQREVLLMIGDWYHRSAEEILAWYTSVGAFGNEPVPDSLVVNGHGAFDCSMAVPARPIECSKINTQSLASMFGYELGTTRLRLINTGSIAGFTVGISHAKLTPLQVDGGCEVIGSPVNYVGILYPGERVDMLVQWDSEVLKTGSEFEIILDPENFNYPNPSLTPNQTFPVFPPFEAPSPSPIPPLTLPPPAMPTGIPENLHYNLQSALAAPFEDSMIPKETDQIILLYTKTQKLAINSNHPMGFINRTSWKAQSPPLISLPRSDWDNNQLIPYIPYSTNNAILDTDKSAPWVDLIINNLDDGSHPFHLHGHSFYVLASHRSDRGWGSYSPWSAAASNAAPEFNLINPLRKDTVSVPRRGYAVLRFQADNRGLWMFHCHVLVHLGSGMAMGLQIGDKDKVDVGAGDLCM